MAETLLQYLETFFLFSPFFHVYNKCGFRMPFCPCGRTAEQFSSRIETSIVTGLHAHRKKCLQIGLLGTCPFSIKQALISTCETLLCFWSNSNRRDFMSFTNSGLTRVGKRIVLRSGKSKDVEKLEYIWKRSFPLFHLSSQPSPPEHPQPDATTTASLDPALSCPTEDGTCL